MGCGSLSLPRPAPGRYLRRMSLTYHPTNGPHDTLLIRWQRRHVGFINRPPSLAGRYRAYTVEGDILADDYPSRLSGALACQAWCERGRLHWSCDGEAAIVLMDRGDRIGSEI
jgi:hypothetical protein